MDDVEHGATWPDEALAGNELAYRRASRATRRHRGAYVDEHGDVNIYGCWWEHVRLSASHIYIVSPRSKIDYRLPPWLGVLLNLLPGMIEWLAARRRSARQGLGPVREREPQMVSELRATLLSLLTECGALALDSDGWVLLGRGLAPGVRLNPAAAGDLRRLMLTFDRRIFHVPRRSADYFVAHLAKLGNGGLRLDARVLSRWPAWAGEAPDDFRPGDAGGVFPLTAASASGR